MSDKPPSFKELVFHAFRSHTAEQIANKTLLYHLESRKEKSGKRKSALVAAPLIAISGQQFVRFHSVQDNYYYSSRDQIIKILLDLSLKLSDSGYGEFSLHIYQPPNGGGCWRELPTATILLAKRQKDQSGDVFDTTRGLEFAPIMYERKPDKLGGAKRL